MDIYAILSSKPHNPHYLNRYIRYINKCREYNQTLPSNTYTEQHHICPKAADLFPEYIDLNLHKWNLITLTAKQHVFAHLILSKLFGRSQLAALHYMLNVQNESFNYNDREVPNYIKARYAAKAKEVYYKSRKGYAAYKDSSGNRYYLETDDPLIDELNLEGCASGNEFSEETKSHMRKMKDPYRKIKLYFLDTSINVLCNQDEYEEYLSQGWLPYYHPNDRDYTKSNHYTTVSEKLSGRADYMTPDGKFYGKLYSDDPIIEELNLSYHNTDKRQEQWNQRAKLAVEFNTGSEWYNDGKINKKFKSDPGFPWVRGGLIEDSAKEARADGIRKVRANTACYNDGEKNYYIKNGDPVPEGLIPGMFKQKPRELVYYKPGTNLRVKCVASDKPDGFFIYNKKNIRIHGDLIK